MFFHFDQSVLSDFKIENFLIIFMCDFKIIISLGIQWKINIVVTLHVKHIVYKNIYESKCLFIF